jgi:hypothetical protein
MNFPLLAFIICRNKSINLKPDQSKPYYYKGIALNSLKKSKEAIKCFDKLMQLEPKKNI